MNPLGDKKVLLCYIDGLDVRSINKSNFPFLYDAIKSYPFASIKSPPTADALPILLTGTSPHENRMWGVRLNSDSYIPSIIDKIPDNITTTVQCMAQIFTGSFDLPTVPPKRRRCFEVLRTQHNKNYKKTENLLNIGGSISCLGVLGSGKCKYLFSRMTPSQQLLNKITTGKYLLEIFQSYNIDLFQRWNLDKPQEIIDLFKKTDEFISTLHQKCRDNNITLILFSDHGYDKVIKYINIKEQLDNLKISKDEYSYFIEISMARFWFHTNDARSKITQMLESIDNASLLYLDDLKKYNLRFSDNGYGDAFIMTHPGYIFFPHDFHHPIGNLFLGLSDSRQTPRIINPVHRGDHCLLPDFDSSKGFIVLMDKSYKARMDVGDLTDVAPTVLDILNYEKPISMKGTSIFVS